LIDSWEAIRSSIIQYIAVILLTTVVVMGCAGFVTQYVIRKGKEKKK
jgi:holin-like protein